MNDDPKLYQQRTQPEWQEYLQNALAAHRQNPHDSEAMQAITQATQALNAYDQEGVNQSHWGKDDFRAVDQGMVHAVDAIPKGVGEMVHHLREGELFNAGKDIYGGLKSTAKGALAPWELALREMTGETVNDKERKDLLHESGGGLVGLEAMALPGELGEVGKISKASGGGGSFGKGMRMPRPLGTGPSSKPTQPFVTPDDAPPGGGPQSLGEADFFENLKKKGATSDQLDPYGLNDAKPKPFQAPPRNINDPLHDILNPDQANRGPTPLHPEDINDILGLNNAVDRLPNKNAQSPSKFANETPSAEHDILSGDKFNQLPKPATPEEINELLSGSAEKAIPKSSFASKPPTTKTPVTKPPVVDVPEEGAGGMDILGLIPGSTGRLGRLIAALPDATTVRNKALTTALKSTILSGIRPDTTKTRR